MKRGKKFTKIGMNITQTFRFVHIIKDSWTTVEYAVLCQLYVGGCELGVVGWKYWDTPMK